MLATSFELLLVNDGLSIPCGIRCADRPKLCPVVVDHKVPGRRNTNGSYEECHLARAVRIHHIGALKRHPEGVAVCAQRRGAVDVALPVEGQPPDLTKG